MIFLFKKSRLYQILGILLAMSCSKVNEPEAPKCSITQSISLPGPSYFGYTSEGKLESYTVVNDTDSITYGIQYDSFGKVSQLSTNNSYSSFDYNSANKITSIKTFDGIPAKDGSVDYLVDHRIDYEYSSSGQMNKQSDYVRIDGQLSLTGYIIFEYPNTSSKNPLTISYYNTSNQLMYQRNFEYDNKYNPFSELPISLFLGVIQENNIVKVTNSADGLTQDVIVNSYTYNEKGWPVSGEIKNQNTGAIIGHELFTYNCK